MTENEAKLKLLQSKVAKKQTTKLAQDIADRILAGSKVNNKELRAVFADLSVEIAALSRRMDEAQKAPTTDFDKSFGKLADSLGKDVVANLSDEQIATLAQRIGEQLSEVISAVNLSVAKLATDTVEVKGLDKMLNKLVDKIPDSIDGQVTLAYNKASAKDFVNVRLTNGQNFIDSMVTAARGVGLPLIKTAGNVMALPVVNPDGSNIGGGGGGSTVVDPRTGFGYSDSATVSTVDYVGYINPDGRYYVMSINSSDSANFSLGAVASYVHGTGFGAWAAGLTYTTFDTAFS